MASSHGDLTFGDGIANASDLAENAEAILDQALQRPITLVRGDQYFALAPRAQVGRWVRAAHQMPVVLEIMTDLFRLASLNQAPVDPDREWLRGLSPDDTVQFITELAEAAEQVLRSEGTTEPVDLVLHEWQETGRAQLSANVIESFAAPLDSILLDPPAQGESD